MVLRRDNADFNEEWKMTEEPRTVEDEATGGSDEEANAGKKVVRLSVGQEMTGTIKQVTEFGAFVDIGAGRDGLVHISELSVGRVSNVKDVVEEGQTVTVWIKRLNRERNRISLTMISPDTKTIRDLQEGEIVEGVVTRMVPYGAFIDIGVGTDALLHVREMGNNYVEKPEDIVEIDEKLEVRVMTLNRRRRHIDVSIKGLREEEEGEEAESENAASAAGEDSDGQVVDKFENIDVLSPMELAFKRATEGGGGEVPQPKSARRQRSRQHRARSVQADIIQRTLDTMRE
jgi:transcriptional accessory protein Tex/SPT6